MPFTPSHAVVALPFVRTPLVPAAIAVGAMAPDLPLFVRVFPLGGELGLHYGRTHALEWLPATVLLALVLLVVWRCALRPAARELSPRALAARLPGEWDRGAPAALRETFAISPGVADRAAVSWRGMLLLVVSLVVGIVSHIAWDLFTHEGRGGVDLLPALAEEWGPLPGYKWLQHGSSVIGLAIIGAYAIVWLARREVAAETVRRVVPDAVRRVWWLSLPLVLVAAWTGGLLALGPLDAEFTVAHLAYRVLPPACAVWGAATLALCVAVQIMARRRVAAERAQEAA